jgi:exopolysaccharide production protein ExoQ
VTRQVRDASTAAIRPDWALLGAAAFYFVAANPIAHAVRGERVAYGAWHPLNAWIFGSAIAVLGPWLVAAGRDRAAVWAAWKEGAAHFLLPGLAAASAAWSLHPRRSLVHGAQLLIVTGFALYLRGRLSPARHRLAAVLALALLALVSVVMVAGWPLVALTRDWLSYRSWKGAFGHKTHLGLVGALLVLLATLGWNRPDHRLWRILAIGLGFLLLVKSRSATAWVTLAGGLAGAVVSRVAGRWPRRTLAALGALAIAGALVVVLAPDLPGRALGRDGTLTGRTTLWRIVVQKIGEAPRLGYGYRAYFHERADERPMQKEVVGERAAIYSQIKVDPGLPVVEEWHFSHSHNGFLDVALDLGLPALLVFVGILFWWSLPALRRIGQGRGHPDDHAFVALAAALVAFNLTEVSFLRGWQPEGLFWLLVLMAAPPRTLP